MYTYLEKLVDPDQLLNYPSDFKAFNQCYEIAQDVQRTASRRLDELYIIQYRSFAGHLHFGFVRFDQIGDGQPYGLKDICAVLRK